jgi:hypothetical protein
LQRDERARFEHIKKEGEQLWVLVLIDVVTTQNFLQGLISRLGLRIPLIA